MSNTQTRKKTVFIGAYEFARGYLESAKRRAISAGKSAVSALFYADLNNEFAARICPLQARRNADIAAEAAEFAKDHAEFTCRLVALYKDNVDVDAAVAANADAADAIDTDNAAAEAVITEALKQVEIAKFHANIALQRAVAINAAV